MSSAPVPLTMLSLAVRERLSRDGRERVPEPMVMDEPESVAAFDSADPILQLPVYRLNAEAASALLPEGGRVLDLGSGTGRLLAHLARARPDVRITGTDLADTMLETGRGMLAAEGLGDRVELRREDMTAVPDELAAGVDLVSCVWALHHLPDAEHARRCLSRIAAIRERTGCAVWIFDFGRLRRAQTMRALVGLSPDAPARLCEDGLASERAAWSVAELRRLLAEAGLGDLRGGPERLVGHFQAYWAPPRDGRPSGHATRWSAEPLHGRSATIHSGLGRTLPHP